MPLALSWNSGDMQPNEDWRGITNQRRRRKLQNRLNQRAYRQRKRAHELFPIDKPNNQLSSNDLQLVQAKQGSNAATIQNSYPSGISYPTTSEVDQIDICTMNTERARTVISQFELAIRSQYLSGSPNPNLLSGVLRLNAMQAFWKNIDILGQTEDDQHDDAISQFCIIGPCAVDINTLPPALRPTELQRTVPHHPWFDLIPVPQMRDNLIRAGDTFDDGLLCQDMSGYRSAVTGRRGIVIWGASWDESCWELTEDFLKRWGWTVRNCTNLFKASNYWREKRGEQPLSAKSLVG